VGLTAGPPGSILATDAGETDRQEYIRLTAIVAGATVDDPATVTLAHALERDHRPGALVQRVTLQPPGTANPLSRAVEEGDSCVFLHGLAGLAGAAVVELTGGLNPDVAELRAVRGYAVASDAAGYYRLPPLSRLAQVELEAADGVHTPATAVVSLVYGPGANRVDLVLE